MRRLYKNTKGQFSIIAALFIAAILITSVMATYSTIRYAPTQNEAQILSAIDETNFALKQVLGFTLGYYGSVLQVTGNSSYAYDLSSNYLQSGLSNIANIRPEWGSVFTVTDLKLKTCWFTNESYSFGILNVTYDLTGIDIYGVSYSAYSKLDVDVYNSPEENRVCLSVIRDDNQPLNDLGKRNFKFYLYSYANSTWTMADPSGEPTSFANGTYLLDVPFGINPQSCSLQVVDSRAITVTASTFSHYTGTLTFNNTVGPSGDYTDESNTVVDGTGDVGTHSDFDQQKSGPDGLFDTLTSGVANPLVEDYFPVTCSPMSLTTISSGSLADLQTDNNAYLQLQSYGTAFSGSATLGYSGSGSSTQNIENRMTGSRFTMPVSGQIQDMLVRLSCSNRFVKAAIYTSSGSLVAGTAQQSVTASDQWVTFTFPNPKPVLLANTNYILVAWAGSGSGSVNMYYTGTGAGRYDSRTYDASSWPSTTSFSTENRNYRIYCTYSPASEYTCEAEFSGPSNLNTWNSLNWTIVSSATTTDVVTSFQLFNYSGAGQYPLGGNGYMTQTLGTSDIRKEQNITDNAADFRDNLGQWKAKLRAVKSTSSSFDIRVDLAQFKTVSTVYKLDLEETWTDVNMTYLSSHPALCINAVVSGTPLAVDVWRWGSWHVLSNSIVNGWNNISISSYLSSPDFTIRFRSDQSSSQNSWQIDAALLRPESDQDLFTSLSDSAATVAVEFLQNGTLRWLGENLQLNSEAIPIPPVPVKSIHVSQKIDGAVSEVPFQVEDWASEYSVPLGLTNNNTVFGNRQMVVFLVNTHVSEFTLWWNGSDETVQTPLAYVNTCFDDDPSSSILSNDAMSLEFGNNGFVITATVGATQSTTTTMRINGEEDDTNPELSYVIWNGVVRDVVLEEPEFSDGVANCPNVYASVVVTFPAHATYFTYRASLMFINSALARTITDLCPISLTCNVGSLQTENGTVLGDPIVANGSGTFGSSGIWGHHWSQFTDGSNGAGVMFTNSSNQMLYFFESMAPSNLRGALKVDSSADTIEVLPVTLNSISFQSALSIAWTGAVVTFDDSLPIYAGPNQSGLWVLAELPPTITIDTHT